MKWTVEAWRKGMSHDNRQRSVLREVKYIFSSRFLFCFKHKTTLLGFKSTAHCYSWNSIMTLISRRLTRLQTMYNVLKYRKTWWNKDRISIYRNRNGTWFYANLIMTSTVLMANNALPDLAVGLATGQITENAFMMIEGSWEGWGQKDVT